MKKEYMKPEATYEDADEQLMLSTSETIANEEGEVLGRHGRNYDDWDEEE